ncbi:MAG: tol-pal system protein YbgF [Gammaproteobacteria bacterium]|nr:tol-pal system protein YbgF [Gammaproteobacteria bacterium]
MIKKILPFVILYSFSSSSFSENNEVLMRMYERLEMIRLQMQQLTEENQQLNNKISILQNQQDRLYQDLANKIQELQENLKKNSQSSFSISKDKINKIEDISSIENKEKEVENKKKLKDIIPSEENELDLAKKYTNNNFKKKLPEYKQKTEIELYRSAFQLVKDKKYSDAIDSFNAFLYLFPKSNYASNAQYWLSESIYALGDFQNAMINFAKVVEIYPESSKIADAKLKIGYCYYSIKKWKEARFIFSSIVKNYPNTSLSQLADKKIKSMDVEGR